MPNLTAPFKTIPSDFGIRLPFLDMRFLSPGVNGESVATIVRHVVGNVGATKRR
jgi:hypothetical protein